MQQKASDWLKTEAVLGGGFFLNVGLCLGFFPPF